MNIVCDCEVNEDEPDGPCQLCGSGSYSYKDNTPAEPVRKRDLSNGLNIEQMVALTKAGFRW